MNEDNLRHEKHSFRHQQPIALSFAVLNAAVYLAAVVLGEQLVEVRVPVLYLYAGIAFASAFVIWRAKNLTRLWIGGTGGMVAAAAGYATMAAKLSNPDLWFFSTGLSLTFAVIVTFHYVWHYIVSIAMVWLVMAGFGLPRFTTPFDFTLGALVVLGAIGTGSFTVFLLGRARRSAYDLQKRLERLAFQDALTGLPNRRAFMERLWPAMASTSSGLHLLMLDIDDFKSINDTMGHDVGDKALQAVAHIIERHSKGILCGRLGGEEFAVAGVMNNDEAQNLAQQIVDAVHGLTIEGRRLSISAGLTESHAEDTGSTLLKRADDALYEAKRAGKNQYRLV